ncbi:hypothetical protein [Streptomyces hygroscopicus]|uniref:hypothetical protein n=1 Tax=Streptomyces hygroscopicus TaxID=1912 RepID=UPI003F1E4333
MHAVWRAGCGIHRKINRASTSVCDQFAPLVGQAHDIKNRGNVLPCCCQRNTEDSAGNGRVCYTATRFAHYASAHLVVVNSTTFLEFIYSTPMISSDDMLYGPFFDKQKCEKEKNHMTCQINFGATFMSVWSMARSLNSSVPPLSVRKCLH